MKVCLKYDYPVSHRSDRASHVYPFLTTASPWLPFFSQIIIKMIRVGLSLVSFLFFPISGFSALVVNPDEEAAGLSTEYLLGHAELVSSHLQQGQCPEVEDEVRVLRYFVQLSPETRQERNTFRNTF